MADEYTVINQRHQTVLQPSGDFIPSVVVTFKIPSGATNQVIVPQAQYSAKYVADQILPLAQEMIAVEKL